MPGNNYEFTQPIQMRFNELISGVRTDVGVKIFGDDLDTLLQVAARVQAVLQSVPGAADVKTEQVSGLPVMTVKLNRAALSRYGISVADVQSLVEIAVGGKNAGHVFEGDRRFDLVVRLPEHLRLDIEALSRRCRSRCRMARLRRRPCARSGATRRSRKCATRRFRRVAKIEIAPGPTRSAARTASGASSSPPTCAAATSARSWPRRSAQIAEKVKLPAGYWIGWGGQFEQLVSAAKRLTIVVPIALLLIFLLLFMSLGSAADALLVFSGVPLALTGGIAALLLRGIPLSISAGIGFIALSGVAVLNGLVIIAFIQKLRAEGQDTGRQRCARAR